MYLGFQDVSLPQKWWIAVCSNAYLLSSKYSPYLVGRSVEIKMLPFSFREFLNFHGLRNYLLDFCLLAEAAGATIEEESPDLFRRLLFRFIAAEASRLDG